MNLYKLSCKILKLPPEIRINFAVIYMIAFFSCEINSSIFSRKNGGEEVLQIALKAS